MLGSLLLSPVCSLRGWSIIIIKTAVKITDMYVVCSVEVMETKITQLKCDHLYLC